MFSFSTTLFCFFYSSSTTKLYDQKLYSRLAVKTWQSVTSASAKSVGKFPLTLQQQKFSTIPIAHINSKLLLLTNDSQGVSVYKHMLFVGHSLEKNMNCIFKKVYIETLNGIRQSGTEWPCTNHHMNA